MLLSRAEKSRILVSLLVLAATLVLAQIAMGTQPTTVISSSTSKESLISGSILYKDSFETASLGKFGWSYGTLPSGWGPDISDEHGSYGEVENTIAQDGKQAVLLHAPKYNESTGRVYSNIARALRGLAEPGFSEFYVRWYARFQVLPGTNWRYIQISHISNGDHATETASVTISRINDTYYIGMSNLWGNITQESAPYPFAVDTWYRFDLYYKYGIADGEYRLWINKEEKIAVTSQDTTPRWYGVSKQFDPVNLPKDWDGGNEHTDDTQGYFLYVDNFLFADYRVDLDWTPPETATVTIRAFDNKTKNPVPNAHIRMGSYEGYTDESGFVTFTQVPTALYTINISEKRYHEATELVGIYEDKSLALYMEPIQPAIFEIHAYTDSTEIVSTVEISDSSSVISTAETPYSLELSPGTYVLKATYKSKTLTETWLATEGKTSIIRFQFEVEDELSFEYKVAALAIIIIIALVGTTFILKHFRV